MNEIHSFMSENGPRNGFHITVWGPEQREGSCNESQRIHNEQKQLKVAGIFSLIYIY